MNASSLRRATIALSLFALLMTGADWRQFRGPNSSGISSETGLPERWSDDENIVWKTEVPGFGASSPITVGDQILMTCYSGYGDGTESEDQQKLRLHLVSFDRASGKQQWNKSIQANTPDKTYDGFIPLHGYASSTPASDGENVYTFFGRSGVHAFSLSGKKLWSTNVGEGTHIFGTANSPTLYKNLVIINASVESGRLVALNKKTGKQVWEVGDIKRSWNTPVLVDVEGGKQELVLNTEGKVRAYHPATGKPLWNCAAVNDYICPSVIAHDGVVYAIGGRSRTCIAVKAGGRGDVTETHRLWTLARGSNVSSPVYFDGYLYWSHEGNGVTYCVDAKTGKSVYETRLTPPPGRIYASPVAVDGKLYYVSRSRGTYVLPAKPEFELLAHNRLASDDSIFNGSPVVSRGQLILRSDKFVYCIGKQSGSAGKKAK